MNGFPSDMPGNDNSSLAAAAGETSVKITYIRDHAAVMATIIVTGIMSEWTEGRPASEDWIVKHWMPEYEPDRVRANYEHALNAAKLIAHSTGLMIPRSKNPEKKGSHHHEKE